MAATCLTDELCPFNISACSEKTTHEECLSGVEPLTEGQLKEAHMLRMLSTNVPEPCIDAAKTRGRPNQ